MFSISLILGIIIIQILSTIAGFLSPQGLREIILGSILSIDTILLILFYISQKRYQPKIIIQTSGSRNRSPIPVKSRTSSIWIGITAENKEEVALEEFSIDYDKESVKIDLNENLVKEALYAQAEKGTQKLSIRTYDEPSVDEIPMEGHGKVHRTTTLDTTNPESLVVSELPKVKNSFMIVYGLEFHSQMDEFSFVVKVTSRVEDYEIGFPWNMFTIGAYRSKHVIECKVDDPETVKESGGLLRYGFPIAPGMAVKMGTVSH